MKETKRVYCHWCNENVFIPTPTISLPNAVCNLCDSCREKPEVKELLDRFRVDLFKIITTEAST